MTKFYRFANSVNAFLVRKGGINPKAHYATLKAAAKRARRILSGQAYGADLKSVNIIVDDRKLLLCGIPKVATQTFLRELIDKRALGQSRIMSTNLSELLAQDPRLAAYYKVGFVRNPWARAVSAYNSKICHPRLGSVRMYFVQYKGLHYRMPTTSSLPPLPTTTPPPTPSTQRVLRR